MKRKKPELLHRLGADNKEQRAARSPLVDRAGVLGGGGKMRVYR